MPQKQPYDKVHEPLKTIVINNFLGGVAWGIGSTLGLAIILAILGFIAKEINVIPFVGEFVTQITRYVVSHK